jgi:hypothetical protein
VWHCTSKWHQCNPPPILLNLFSTQSNNHIHFFYTNVLCTKKANFSCLNTCILIYFVDRLWNTEALNFLSGPHLEKECFLKAVQNILNQITLNIKHCLHLFIFKLNFLRYQQHLLQRYFFSTSIHLLCKQQLIYFIPYIFY